MNDEIGQKVFQQVMDIWITPEMKERRRLEKINDNFVLYKAQIIFSLYGGIKLD